MPKRRTKRVMFTADQDLWREFKARAAMEEKLIPELADEMLRQFLGDKSKGKR